MPVSVRSHNRNHKDTPTCWCCTYLCVCAVFSVTLVADKHVRLGSSDLRQLMFSDGFFGQSLSNLLQLCTCHLLHTNTKTSKFTHLIRLVTALRKSRLSAAARQHVRPQRSCWQCVEVRCFRTGHSAAGLDSSGPSGWKCGFVGEICTSFLLP